MRRGTPKEPVYFQYFTDRPIIMNTLGATSQSAENKGFTMSSNFNDLNTLQAKYSIQILYTFTFF